MTRQQLASLSIQNAQLQQLHAALMAEYQEQETWDAIRAHEASTRRNAAFLHSVSDWHLGQLSAELLSCFGIPTQIGDVFSTSQSRAHIARQRPGDAEFITRNLPDALAAPYMF